MMIDNNEDCNIEAYECYAPGVFLSFFYLFHLIIIYFIFSLGQDHDDDYSVANDDDAVTAHRRRLLSGWLCDAGVGTGRSGGQV